MIEQRLIDAVIDQIKFDLEGGSTLAIEEMLRFVPKENLIGFLSEENLEIDLDGGLSAINE